MARNRRNVDNHPGADKRFSGALKILELISRGALVVSGPRGVMALQNKYGI